ncbi:hypothetical protein EDB80DRAFT_882556 [Ilyonectria destructans]|nr:hypothetical protein EDB80DRAFT_882556 [Ilyonectria destructans]
MFISFNLPKDGSQNYLIAGVTGANLNTIVINSIGFPGQEAGNSIADILTSTQNPKGYLTTTFPKRLEDCPAYGNSPGEYTRCQLTVKYAEGVFIGYRHFDRLSADKVPVCAYQHQSTSSDPARSMPRASRRMLFVMTSAHLVTKSLINETWAISPPD